MILLRLFHPAFLLAILLLWALTGHAQQVTEYGALKVQRFTEADGLISSETGGTFRDRFGFLWITTFSGVSRFDGRRFENFNRQSGLTETNVEALGEDDGGSIYFKAVTTVYRYTGNRAKPFVALPTNGGFVAAACPTNTGQVWVAYEETPGLSLVSASGVVASIVTNKPILQMARSASGEVYVLDAAGQLFLLTAKRLQPVARLQPKMPFQNAGFRLYKSPNGSIWTYAANNSHFYKYTNSRVSDSIAVPTGTSWKGWFVGSAGGVYAANDDGSISQLVQDRWQPLLTRAQIKGVVYDVAEAADGTTWVGATGGLLRLWPKQYKTVAAQAPLSYFTTTAQGRLVLQTDSLLYHIPTAVAAYNRLLPQAVSHVYVTRSRDVWFCTEAAVYELPYGKPLRQLNTTTTYEGAKALFQFRRVMEDGTGGIWISSYHGLFYKRGDSLRYFYNREGLTEGALYGIAIDAAGTVFVSGVRVYAFDKARFYPISSRLGLPNEITRLATDSKKQVWVCQEGTGLVVRIGLQHNGGYYAADSLALKMNNRTVTGMSACFDAADNLWVCDNRALYCYQRNKGSYATSPLFWNEGLAGSPLLYPDAAGNVQVAANLLSGEPVRSYPAQAMLQGYAAVAPKPMLTDLQLYKQPFNWQQAGFTTNALGVPQRPLLTCTQNFLRFSFTAITPSLGDNWVYRYRLVGYQDEWSPISETGEAEYTGLPSGAFTFEVQARAASGEWSEPLQYPFRIKQKWFLRWWAVALWLLMAASLIGDIIDWRAKARRRKASTKRLLVEEQLKAMRAQINPHFLQNTFAFLAHELYQSQNTAAVKVIDRLSLYLRDVLRYSDTSVITLEDELAFAEEYLQLQQELLSTPFTYTIAVDEAVDLFDVQVPSMLLQPLIENALKHGLDKENKNEITVDVCITGNHLRCTITDTGSKTVRDDLRLEGSGKGIALTVERMNLFYEGKGLKPSFYRHRNDKGGCDAVVLLPMI